MTCRRRGSTIAGVPKVRTVIVERERRYHALDDLVHLLLRSRHVACEKLVDDDHASKFCFRQVVVGCIELSSSRARPRDGRNNYGSRHVKPTRKGLHAWRGRELSAAKDDFPAIHVSID
ncbi:hypothetical protein ACOSQ4_008052 [Xanthoceras sorbifolium]